MIGQVNAAFEGRIKSTVQGTFITLPCCRTTEMRKRQHSEDDNKDIMMGNTTLKCQWNGQFWKPSGKQVLQKHDNLLNGFPALLLLFFFFFPCSTTVNSVLAFGSKNKRKRKKCQAEAECQSLKCLSSQMREVEICLVVTAGDGELLHRRWKVQIGKGIYSEVYFISLKTFGRIVGGLCMRRKYDLLPVEGRWSRAVFTWREMEEGE